MNTKLTGVKAVLCAFALSGCVSIDSIKTKLESSDPTDVNDAQEQVFRIVTEGRDKSGFIRFTTNESAEYLKIVSDNGLLLRILDESPSHELASLAIARLNFKKPGLGFDILMNHPYVFKHACRIEKNELVERYVYWFDNDELKDFSGFPKIVVDSMSDKELLRVAAKASDSLSQYTAFISLLKRTKNVRMLTAMYHDKNWTKARTHIARAFGKVVHKVTDKNLILELLAERKYENPILNLAQKKILIGKLPKADAESYALTTVKEMSPRDYITKGGVDSLRAALMVAEVSKNKAFVKDLTLELGKGIAKACAYNSWGWEEYHDKSMKDLIKALPKMDAELLREFVKQDNRLWRFCDELIDANLAAQMLLNRECPTDEMEKAFLSKIPADKIDIDLYDALVYKQTKEAAYGIMTNEVKEQLAKRHHDKIVRAIAVAEKDANELRQLFSTVKFNYSQTERLKSFIKERAFYFKNVTTWTVNCLGAPQGITRVAFKCSDDDANNILLVYVDFEGECKEAIRGLKPFDKVSFLGAGNKECSYSLGITLKGLIVDDKTSEDKMVDFIEKCGVTDAEIDAMLEDGESIVRRYAKSEGVEFPSEDAMKKAKSKASSLEEARKAVGDIRDVLEDIKEVKDEFDKAWSDAKSEANKTLNEVVNDKDVQELKRSMDELKSMTDALKGLSF